MKTKFNGIRYYIHPKFTYSDQRIAFIIRDSVYKSILWIEGDLAIEKPLKVLLLDEKRYRLLKENVDLQNKLHH